MLSDMLRILGHSIRFRITEKHALGKTAAIGLSLAVLASSMLSSAAGHGLGSDQSQAVTVGKQQIAVQASIRPSFYPIDSTEGKLLVRAFDTTTNATIAPVDYAIHFDLHGTTLLEQRFASDNGILSAKLIPDPGINGWQIDRKTVPVGEQVKTRPTELEIKSRILTTGGLYHLKVTIEKTSTGFSGLESDLNFDLYISISMDFKFNDILTPSGPRTMIVTSYYDEPGNLTYSNRTISFQMPFNWASGYSSQVPLIHMELKIPKSITEFQANSYLAKVNGFDVEERSILIDDYSSKDFRIVHFVLTRSTLDTLSAKVAPNSKYAIFSLTPAGSPKFPIDVQSLPAGKYIFELSWGPRIIRTGATTTFALNIQDPTTGDLSRDTGFDFVLRSNGSEVFRQHLYSGIGIFSEDYVFQKAGTYRLSAENINGKGESSAMDLQVLQGNSSAAPIAATKPSGCLIATAAFGSELAPQVQYLRDFRDEFVMKSTSGAAFMTTFNDVYYSFSPQVADYERKEPILQESVKASIYPLLGILTLAEHAHHVIGGEQGTILAGGISGLLIGTVYLWPAGILVPSPVRSRWFILAVMLTASAMAITLFVLPSGLMYTTSAFVISTASLGAVLVPRMIRRAVK